MSLGEGVPQRGLETYERFTSESGSLRPRPIGELRALVRSGVRLGSCRLRSRDRESVRWELNAAQECEAPVVFHYVGRPASAVSSENDLPSGVRKYYVSTAYRCRQCGWCRMMRASHWSHRAVTEFDRAAATWLGTITLSPLEHARVDARLAKRAHARGAAWLTDWKPADLFRARCRVIQVELTSWLKRVRQEIRQERIDLTRPHLFYKGVPYTVIPARFKFLLVAEEHKSERTSTTMVGRPHYHVLIHEELPFELIRPDEYYVTRNGVVRVADKAAIRTSWKFGFTQFELCRDARSASYLCKYLSKDMLWRVRASVKTKRRSGYGDDEVLDRSGATGRVTDEGNARILGIRQEEEKAFSRASTE